MAKIDLFQASLSCTSLLKSRCKFCGSRPTFYYYSLKTPSYYDIDDSKAIQARIQKFIKEIIEFWYMIESPSSFRSIQSFSHDIYYNKYDPRSHKTYGYHPKVSNTIDHLSCDCGKTTWAFNQTSGAKNPIIKQKRIKPEYKKKIIY